MIYSPSSLITAILICFSNAIYASEGDWIVRGIIIDDETRKPISGANIYIVDSPSLTATSNSDGFFNIDILEPGEYELGVFSFGYERFSPQSFRIGKNISPPTVTVRLLPTISKMPPIVITASRDEKEADVIKLSGSDLASVAGTGGDPVRGLRYLPGIAVQYDFSAEPAIRGSTPDDNIYYIDFVPTPQLFHADGAVSVLPDEIVSTFDLQASAFDSGYDNVTGAAINIELRAPNKKYMVRQIDLKATQIGFLLEGPTSTNQSFLLSGRQSYLDLIAEEVSLDSSNVETNTPVFSDFFIKYLWDFSNTSTVTLQLRGAKDEIGFEILSGSDFSAQQPELVGETNITSDTQSQALVWQYKPNNSIANKLATGTYQTKLDSQYASAINEQVITHSTFVRNQLALMSSYTNKTTITWSAEKKSVEIDYDSLNDNCTLFDISCDLSGASRRRLSDTLEMGTAAFAVSHQWLMTDRSRATFGVRASKDNYLNSSFVEPRLSYKYKSSRQTEWNFGLGKHHQQPLLEFIIPTFGNPQLSPIESLHAVFGVRKFFAARWIFKSELYAKTFDNLVLASDTQNYSNGGSGKSRGIEVLIRKRSSKNMSGWLSVTASKSELSDETNEQTFPFDYDQPLTASLVLNYRFNHRWSSGLQWQYHTGQPFTPIESTSIVNGVPEPIYGDINSERLPDYHRLDLRVEYQNKGKQQQTTTFFEIINVYNRDNVAGYNYGKYFRKQTPLKQLPIFLSFGVKTVF